MLLNNDLLRYINLYFWDILIIIKNLCICDKLVVCIFWYVSIVDKGYCNVF